MSPTGVPSEDDEPDPVTKRWCLIDDLSQALASVEKALVEADDWATIVRYRAKVSSLARFLDRLGGAFRPSIDDLDRAAVSLRRRRLDAARPSLRKRRLAS